MIYSQAKNFLYSIMHDKSAPLADRVQAAGHLLLIEPDGPPRPTVIIKIYGFGDLELREYFESLPEAEQQDILRAVSRFERCNELDVGPIDHMQVKGHA